jgi:quinol monooxygenase YgiN
MDANDLPLELAQFDLKPGSDDAFCREITEALPLIAAAKGCRGVTVCRSVEHPHRFRLLVRWDSIDDHVAFRSTQAVTVIRAIFARHVESKAETEHLVRIASAGGGA